MKRVKVLIAIAIVGLIAVGVWLFVLRGQIAYARLATAYAAKQVCSCRFIGARSMQSCMGDFTADISALTISQASDRIIAKAPLGMARASARYTPQLGCVLEPQVSRKS